MTLHLPRSPLFPYTTLFRSVRTGAGAEVGDHGEGLESCGRDAALDGTLEHPGAGVGSLARGAVGVAAGDVLERSEEHTSELQSLTNLVCRLLLEKKKEKKTE